MDKAKEVLGAVFMVYSMASLLLVGSTRAARWGQINENKYVNSALRVARGR